MKIKTFFQSCGAIIDNFYIKKVGATPIPGSENKLLLLCVHPYQGAESVKLSDDIEIMRDEAVAEFHFNNGRILEIARTAATNRPIEWLLLKILKEELALLAKACREGAISEEIRGFYGVNVLSGGAKRLGFTLVPLADNWQNRLIGFWESSLRRLYYSNQNHVKTGSKKSWYHNKPCEAWLSRASLLMNY